MAASVTVQSAPPRPYIGPLLWLRSWLAPVRGWTRGGEDASISGNYPFQREWEVHRGVATQVGTDHQCKYGHHQCRCFKDRQFRVTNA